MSAAQPSAFTCLSRSWNNDNRARSRNHAYPVILPNFSQQGFGEPRFFPADYARFHKQESWNGRSGLNQSFVGYFHGQELVRSVLDLFRLRKQRVDVYISFISICMVPVDFTRPTDFLGMWPQDRCFRSKPVRPQKLVAGAGFEPADSWL